MLSVSLGVQFAIMGLDPPGEIGVAWGWIVCSIVSIPMGLAGLLVSLGSGGESGLVQGLLWYGHRAKPCEDQGYRPAYTALVLLGAASGVYATYAFFTWVAR